MAQKYGDTVLPLTIERDKFEAIRAALEQQWRSALAKNEAETNQGTQPEIQASMQPKQSSDVLRAKEQNKTLTTPTVQITTGQRVSDRKNTSTTPVGRQKSQGSRVTGMSTNVTGLPEFDWRVSRNENVLDYPASNEKNIVVQTELKVPAKIPNNMAKSLPLGRGEQKPEQPKMVKQLRDPVHMLNMWYKLDENCTPAVYTLQDIGSVLQVTKSSLQ